MHHHYPWSKHQKLAAYFILLIATQMEIETHCLESIWRTEIVEGCKEHNILVSELKGGGRCGTIS